MLLSIVKRKVLTVQFFIIILSQVGVYTTDIEEIANLTCSLEHDFCNWTIETDTLSPEEFDLGWTMFSPHLDGQISNKGDGFAVAKTKDDMRTFLITSPYISTTSWLSLAFRFAVTGDSSISIYILQDKSYKYLWSSSEFITEDVSDNEEFTNDNNTYEKQTGGTTITLQWYNETLSTVCKAFEISKSLQIAFVAYIKPNDIVALSEIRTTVLSQKPEICIDEENDTFSPNTSPDDPTTNAWKFFIIFSMLLGFGAVFLTALLVIGRSNRPILVPANVEKTQDFENPTYRFRYDRLDESEA